MKRLFSTNLILVFLLTLGTLVFATDILLLKNIGLILDTPFLHQSERPYRSEFRGPLGDSHITYTYNSEGMPMFLSFRDLHTGVLTMHLDIAYAPDGHIASLRYTGYDENDGSILFGDTFEFSDFLPTGPTTATLVTDEGITAEMRLRYDEAGRLVELQEESTYGEGLFRQERYLWAGENEASLPYAMEVRYPLDQDVERYHYLYDAKGRLQGLSGVSFFEMAPYDQILVTEHHFYESLTLDDIFGPIQ